MPIDDTSPAGQRQLRRSLAKGGRGSRSRRPSSIGILAKWLGSLRKGPPIVAAIVAAVIGLSTFTTAVSTILKTLADLSDRVRILSVAKRYVRPGGGEFVRLSQGYWIEHTESQTVRFVFQELAKTDGYVYLYDSSRLLANDRTNPLQVRIPIKGGMAQWSYANPVQWTDLFEVRPEWTDEPKKGP
jgi:hypothetical protein